MRQYVLEVVINESNDEFFEDLGKKSGCDDIYNIVQDAVNGTFLDNEVRLQVYINNEN